MTNGANPGPPPSPVGDRGDDAVPANANPAPDLDDPPVPDAVTPSGTRPPRDDAGFLPSVSRLDHELAEPRPQTVVGPGAVVASLLVGAGATWLAAAMARLVAVVVYAPDAWRHGAWAGFAGGAGLLAAHRYGGTARRDAWLLTVASVVEAVGAALGAVPSAAVPELVHAVVIAAGWLLMAFGVGTVGGVAIRRTGSLSALAVGAVAAGSAAAFATAPLLLEVLGAPALAMAAAAVGGAASLVLAATEPGAGWAGRTAIGLAGTLIVGATLAPMVVAPNPSTVPDPGRVPVAKSLFASVASAEENERHVSARWGAGGRLDVTVAPNGARWLYLDGLPFGVVAPQGRIRPDGAILPFVLPGKAGRVLIVGLGAGQEVRAALEAGATTVVVAEPHPGAVATVKLAQAAAGGPSILDGPGVRIVSEEARAWLRAGEDRFDLILVTLASFGAAAEPGRASGATLLTREAIGDYMDHLDAEGTLAIRVRDDHELWRTFNTAFQAMADAGAPTPTDAIRHLLAVNDGTAGGTLEDITLPTVFVRKTAYSQANATEVLQFLLQAPFPPLFVPYSESRSVLAIIGTEDGPATAESGVPYDITPARDSRPYFQEAGKGLPWSTVAIALALAFGTAIATWAAAHRPNDFGDLYDDVELRDGRGSDRRPDRSDAVPWRSVIVAAVAGLASGTIGATVLWRLTLLAGRADLTNAAGGAAITIGGVAAAFAVHRAAHAGVRAVAGWGALLAAILPFFIAEALPLAAPLMVGRSLEERVTIGALIAVPVGFGLGAQLPALLRLLRLTGHAGWEALVWGATASSAAGGMALAQLVSRASGDTATTVIGATASLGCFLAFGLRWVSDAGPAAQAAPPPSDWRP